jgi:hypothetical protein
MEELTTVVVSVAQGIPINAALVVLFKTVRIPRAVTGDRGRAERSIRVAVRGSRLQLEAHVGVVGALGDGLLALSLSSDGLITSTVLTLEEFLALSVAGQGLVNGVDVPALGENGLRNVDDALGSHDTGANGRLDTTNVDAVKSVVTCQHQVDEGAVLRRKSGKSLSSGGQNVEL